MRSSLPLPLPLSLMTAVVLAGHLATPLRADPIDDYLRQEIARRRIPGLALAIARDGEIVRQSFYGLANVETGTPVDERSVFAIASLDKQITAAGVLRAAELDKLRLDDPIAKSVEVDLPGVTLRHLLSHTSGLPDSVAEAPDGRGFLDYSTAQLLAHVQGLAPLHPPSHGFHYSDAGLFLAQLATERATGGDWWAFMRRELFAPLGMQSVVSMEPATILDHRVSAYTLAGPPESPVLVRDRRLDIDYDTLYSDLGMTAGDFARFLAAQDQPAAGRGLDRESVATLTAETRLADGSPAGEFFQWSRYGLGVGLDDLLGEPMTLHSGHSGVGFARFPRQKLSIVVFTNLEHPVGSDPVSLAIGVAGLLEARLSLANLASLDSKRARLAPLEPIYDALTGGGVSASGASGGTGLRGATELDLRPFAPAYRATAWSGASGLAGRARRLGPRHSVRAVAEGTLDGQRTVFVRGDYELGTLLLRFSLDERGFVTRIVWWHL